MKVTVSVGLDHDFVVKMRKIAHAQETSISALCADAIVEYVDKLEKAARAKGRAA